MNAKILLAACAAMSVTAVRAEEVADVAKGWDVMPVAVVKDAKDVLPESGEWKTGAFGGVVPQVKGAKKGDAYSAEYNAWYRKSFDMPADWKNRDVVLELNMNALDAVVFVNGKRAGTMFHMQDKLSLSPFLSYGATNEVKIFVTNGGFGIGEMPNVYHGRDDGHVGMGHLGYKSWGATEPGMRLHVHSPVWAEAPYALPSWRKKNLTVSATVYAREACEAEFGAVVREDVSGAVAKEGKTKVTLKPGENRVELVIPWANPKTWECVPHAFMYNCEVTLTANGASCDVPSKFLFGFREIWREGKEIMMNGHIQRFRGFWEQGVPKDLNDLHKFGYNLAYMTHQHSALFAVDAKRMEAYSRAGVCVFAATPSIYSIHGWTNLWKSEDCFRSFKRHLRYWAERSRNWPCLAAASCGVNQLCPSDNMIPTVLAQRWSRDFNGIVRDIEMACDEARKLHPNCLYFSHADGTERGADLSTSNLYFNFTPLQEREEWLSSWAKFGIRPWYAAEFGAPYYACWFHSRVPEMTEWLSVYYGERAYAEESEELLKRLKPFAKDCQRLTHGGWVDGGKDLYSFSPLAEEYSRMLVYRTNRAWRGYGQNGGMMYLTSWPWDDKNAMCDRQRQANGDLVTWFGGAPLFTDRTHAYVSGAKIAKNLVFCWDGFGEKTVTATWKFVEKDGGKVLTSGQKAVTLKQGDIRLEPVEVTAPDVKTRTAYRFEIAFDAPGIDASVKTDAFDVEAYPAETPKLAAEGVALYDPEGDTAPVLDAFGLSYTKVDTLAPVGFKYLVLGRHALDHAAGLEEMTLAVKNGLRIFIFNQSAETWSALGFKIEDSMARQLYNVALEGVDDIDLQHWRGSPMGAPTGNVMRHKTRRGPRWTHTHAIASTPFIIPNRAGFRPLVRGEFDMSYTALCEARCGKGSATYCAFDFEGRIGGEKACPAATAVAYAALKRFFAEEEAPVRTAVCAGKDAERLAKALGLEAVAYKGGSVGKNEVLIAGPDCDLAWEKLEDAVSGGFFSSAAHAVVFGNARLASEAGLADATGTVWRVADAASVAAQPLFAGVGRALLRWRDTMNVTRMKSAGKFTAFGDGVFATDGRVVFDATDPFALCDRYRAGADAKVANTAAAGGWGICPANEKDLYLRSAAQTEENDLRRFSLVLGNLGVGAGEKVFMRTLYAKPFVGRGPIGEGLLDGTSEALGSIGHVNVLGPWPCPAGDWEKTLDTIFEVEKNITGDSGDTAEKMAIAGDVQPNPRFHPVGVTYPASMPSDLRFIDWRPTWNSHPSGVLAIDWMPSPTVFSTPCAWYAVGYLPRTKDCTVSLRFQTKYAGKVWINGKEVARSTDDKPVTAEGIPLYAEGHKGDGTFEGRNVISMKIVSGPGSKNFRLQVSAEPSDQDAFRDRDPELDKVPLVETANPYFDPYEYVYW